MTPRTDLTRRTFLAFAAAGAAATVATTAVGGLGATAASAAGTSAAKVLLIVVDGVRYDRLIAASTPAIDALAATGQLVESTTHDTSLARTDSGPGHSNILTGVWPDRHGVIDNSFAGSRIADHPDFLTRLERANPRLRTFSSADWAPINASILGSLDVKLTPTATAVEDRDDLTLANAVAELREGDPDAMYVYFHSPDTIGHRDGVDAATYITALEQVDARVGQVVAAMRARPDVAKERWLVMLTSDHGFTGRGHGGNQATTRSIPLLATGPGISTRTGQTWSQVDVAPTALQHMGVAIDPAWQLAGRRIS